MANHLLGRTSKYVRGLADFVPSHPTTPMGACQVHRVLQGGYLKHLRDSEGEVVYELSAEDEWAVEELLDFAFCQGMLGL